MFRDKMRESEERTVKSLNSYQRRKESERIERENFKFAKRLLEKSALIDIKEINDEYEQSMRYRQMILKVSPKKETWKLLPPLSKNSQTICENPSSKTDSSMIVSKKGHKKPSSLNKSKTIEDAETKKGGAVALIETDQKIKQDTKIAAVQPESKKDTTQLKGDDNKQAQHQETKELLQLPKPSIQQDSIRPALDDSLQSSRKIHSANKQQPEAKAIPEVKAIPEAKAEHRTSKPQQAAKAQSDATKAVVNQPEGNKTEQKKGNVAKSGSDDIFDKSETQNIAGTIDKN